MEISTTYVDLPFEVNQIGKRLKKEVKTAVLGQILLSYDPKSSFLFGARFTSI